jgi:uncharacterized protein
MIQRPIYLERLKNRMWNDSIKIVTGIRRSGKSFLLKNIFIDYLLSIGVQEKNIITFSFDSAIDLATIAEDLVELEKQKRNVDYKKFIAYINPLITPTEKYYMILDEVQRLDSFEFVLNGYLSMGNIDIYVTGSNSKFLSSDVITEFRGRGDEIHLLPLSFSEFLNYSPNPDISKKLDEYMTFGGLPRAVLTIGEEAKMNYLSSQLEKTFLKDVIDRNNIKNTEELDELMNIIASGISSLTNPTKLENRFLSEKKIKLTADTITSYIKHLKESYILDQAFKYDIKGKAYISTPFKIYFEDIGLRNAKLNFRQVEYTHLMENVIFNELKFRGYKVDVGFVNIRENNLRKQLEVDFVANSGNQRYYIQSAYDIADEAKLQQETKSLDYINDSFKKIVVVNKSIVSKRNDKGYLFISLADFLLNQDSLKL